MERLTTQIGDGRFAIVNNDGSSPIQQTMKIPFVINRLGTIEDILGDNYDIDKVRELIESAQDGRCVILPCKIGTPVYAIKWHIGCAAMDDESYKFVYDFPQPFRIDMLSEFGKTVFLTREAAEAALKGEQDGKSD